MRATASALPLSLTSAAPATAQISATASPVSNSSAPNPPVQITSQYQKLSFGSGIQDGATLNISPFVSGVHSWGDPNNQTYNEPVYDNSDNFGLIDPETGLNGPDGIPGKVLYFSRSALVTAPTTATTLASPPKLSSVRPSRNQPMFESC